MFETSDSSSDSLRDSKSDGGGGEHGGDLVSDRQTRFGGSEKSGLSEAGSDRPRHFKELAWSKNLGGEVGGELEADLSDEAGSDRPRRFKELAWSKNLGGEVGGELEADLPDEADGTLISVLNGESGRDVLVHCKVEASSSPAINSSPSGVSGGEFDAELFCDLGADVVIEMGLRTAASERRRGPVGPESMCELDSGLTCNRVSYTKNYWISIRKYIISTKNDETLIVERSKP